MPSWYSDLVHLTKTRPELTIDERARILGMSKSGVANALKSSVVQSLISGELDTEAVQTSLSEKSKQIEANLEQSRELLDRVKDMVTVTGDALEGVANGFLAGIFRDEGVTIELKINTAMHIRDQVIDLKKAYAIPAPTQGGALGQGNNFFIGNPQMLELVGNIQKISGTTRRTEEDFVQHRD